MQEHQERLASSSEQIRVASHWFKTIAAHLLLAILIKTGTFLQASAGSAQEQFLQGFSLSHFQATLTRKPLGTAHC